jgi:tetratricopeptide (TPR) repeat protein
MGFEDVVQGSSRGLLDYTIEKALECINSDDHMRDHSRLYSMISDAMFQKAQYTDAVFYGEKSVEADPENPDGYAHLGWAEYWLGRNQDAAAHLEKAVELGPNKPEYHYRLGSVYSNVLGRLQEAETEFTRAVELDPEHQLAFQQRGICRYNQGKYDEAEADYRQAAELGDSYSAYCLYNNGSLIETAGEKLALARDFWAQNDSQTAVDYLQQALDDGFDTTEKTVQAVLELADKYSVMKLIDDAEINYNRALELDPGSADAYGRRGWHCYITSQDEQAEADLRKAMEMNPGSSIYPARLGNLYAVSGRPGEGVEVLDPAIDRDPISPDLFYSRALCHKALGNVEQSKHDFRRADFLGHRSALSDRRTAYGDEYPIDYFSAGIEMGDQNNLTGAVEKFRIAADMFLEQTALTGDRAWRYAAKSLHNLGYYIHLSGGDSEEARSTIREALKMDPGYQDAWVTLGNVYNSANENDPALECYGRAIELQPNDGRGYYSRGRIYMAREQWDEGVSDFTGAINLYQRRDWRGDAFYNRARCHEGAGRIQDAIADYNEAFNHGIQQGIQETLRLKDQYGLD